MEMLSTILLSSLTDNSGLCVFRCATTFTSIGAILALLDFDIGPESAFVASEAAGGLCFAGCEYFHILRHKLEGNVTNNEHNNTESRPGSHGTKGLLLLDRKEGEMEQDLHWRSDADCELEGIRVDCNNYNE